MSLQQAPFTDLQVKSLNVINSFSGNIAIGITTNQFAGQLADNSYVVLDSVNRVCTIYLKIAISAGDLTGAEGLAIVNYVNAENPINGEIPPINTEAPNSDLNPIVFRGNYSVTANQFNTADFGFITDGSSNQIVLLQALSVSSGNYVLSGTITYPY